MVLTAEQQARLRMEKALETRDENFKPRGEANKALFEKMKQEFDKKAKEINLHTSSVGDRISKEITPVVNLFSGGDSTNPQDRINARVLQNAANSKANKADRELIREQKAKAKAEAKGKAKARAKAKGKANKPAASNATASTAAPSEQMESDTNKNEVNDDGEPTAPSDFLELDPSEIKGGCDDSSDEEEPMPPKPTPTTNEDDEAMPPDDVAPQRKRKHSEDDASKTQDAKKARLTGINPKAIVKWIASSDEAEKDLSEAINDVFGLLRSCKDKIRLKQELELLDQYAKWQKSFETNWKDEEWAVYLHRCSPSAFYIGECLCRVSLNERLSRY